MERIESVEEIRYWPGDMPVEHLYTAGVAGERFLRELKDNARIVAVRCPECQANLLPPRQYCERCFSETTEWVPLTGRGVVHSYTLVGVDLDGKPLADPVPVAVIKLDGADGSLVHYLGELGGARLRVGLPVEPVFRPAEERTGSIRDILCFRPAEGRV